MTLSEVKGDILSEIDRFEHVFSSDGENDGMSKVLIYYQKFFDEVVLFIFYHDLVDYHSIRLLHDELIDDLYADSNKSYELFERQSQHKREQLLKRTGILHTDIQTK